MLFAQRLPDLVMLDLMLPKVPGLEVLRAIRAQLPDVPVIVTSNSFTNERMDAVWTADATQVLTKASSSPKEIARIVREALERPAEKEGPGSVFEPFFTTKAPGKGTGLGLSTVYGIVKQSDGFIWAYSEVGQGTSFKMYLPQVADVAGGKRHRPTVAPAGGTETILLVEDVEGLRKLAKRMLESAGYTVLLAANGEEALLLLERYREPVHLMVTDVVMPGMSGQNVAKRLDRTAPGTKVLYMSGYTDDIIVRHGVLDEGMPFLGKPFTVVELTRKVREVLDSQS